MSPVLTSEKTAMPSLGLTARGRGSEAIELTDQEIEDTWKPIARKYGEDVAQEALYQVLKKASRGKVEKPRHYAAKSAKNIAKDQRKRQRYALAYQKALSGERIEWESEGEQTHKRSLVVYKKLPIAAPRSHWDQPDLMEVLEVLREISLDSTGHLLIRQAFGEQVEITPSQESKFRARLRQKLKAEKRECEAPA